MLPRIAACFLLACAVSSVAGPPTESDAEQWLRQLESENVEERDLAESRLAALASPWKPFLEARFAAASDPEVRSRLGRLIRNSGKPRWMEDPETAIALARETGRPILAIATPGGPGDFS